ncbi:SAFB-like transcription modulator [Rhipicephalus sanguineus]|uniref:SAFB-like transcription modulator n=1 Tax=Rhipicephalus sanguineus TaxID=34632 RepID=UPI0018942DF4|nr:SAFB-like transcription modulator [Rhipicephalus sanguineus]
MEAALEKLLETMERLDVASALYCAARGHAESAAYCAAKGVVVPTLNFGWLTAPVGRDCMPAQEEPEGEVVDVVKEDDSAGSDAGFNQCEYDLKGDDLSVMQADDVVDLSTSVAATEEDQPAATRENASAQTSAPSAEAGTDTTGDGDCGMHEKQGPGPDQAAALPAGQGSVLASNYEPQKEEDGGEAEEEDHASAPNENASSQTPKLVACVGTETVATRTAGGAAPAEAKKDAAEGRKALRQHPSWPPLDRCTEDKGCPRTVAQRTRAAGAATQMTPNAATDEETVRNLWVSRLANNTQAAELKALFGKCSKVVSAKIGSNDKAPGARSDGFLTMSAAEKADKCIQKLRRTERSAKMLFPERMKHKTSGALLEPQPETETGAAAWATAKTKDVLRGGGEATSSLERGNVWGTVDNHNVTTLAHVSTGGDKAQQRGPLRMCPDRDKLYKRARRMALPLLMAA